MPVSETARLGLRVGRFLSPPRRHFDQLPRMRFSSAQHQKEIFGTLAGDVPGGHSTHRVARTPLLPRPSNFYGGGVGGLAREAGHHWNGMTYWGAALLPLWVGRHGIAQ